MKKTVLMAVGSILLIASTAFADDFVKNEADRSGATGTLNMIGSSISGFFGHLASPFKGKKAE